MKWRGLRRTFSDFQQHPILHGLSILTIAISLLIVGVFFLCYRNVERIAEKTNPASTATIYLKEGLAPVQIDALAKKLKEQPGIASATYRSKATVVAELESFLGLSTKDPIPGAELFPDIFELELRQNLSHSRVEAIKTSLGKFSEIVEVDFSEEWLAQYKRIRQVMKIVGAILMVGLMLGCSFIIANFMGMRHQARRREIEIVRLMGAHARFIATPFVWEGMIEGCLGAGVALTLLHLGRSAASAATSAQWSKALGMRDWLYLSPGQIALIITIGLAMAFLGSLTVFFRLKETSEG